MVFLLACITMVIDHIGLLFYPWVDLFSWFPWDNELRVIGRFAFPLFAWGIVRWFRVTRDKTKYLKRLFFLWIASQIPFLYIDITYNIEIINVIFTLLFWLLSIWLLEEKKIDIFLRILGIGFLIIFAEFAHFDYGAYWVLSVLILHIFWERYKAIPVFALLTFLFYNLDYKAYEIVYHYQIFSVIWVAILYLTPIIKYDFKINFYVKYLFYPVHFALLLLIFYFIS
jgi:small-conductance mechanosensitive channel